MRFGVSIPDTLDPRVAASAARSLAHVVVGVNQQLMRLARSKGRPVPRLYESGVRWAMERDTEKCGQTWALWPEIVRRGWGDCKDLCAWRVAELRATGEDPGATVLVYWRADKSGKPRMYHAEVRRTNAAASTAYREDPSRFLGMGLSEVSA